MTLALCNRPESAPGGRRETRPKIRKRIWVLKTAKSPRKYQAQSPFGAGPSESGGVPRGLDPLEDRAGGMSEL